MSLGRIKKSLNIFYFATPNVDMDFSRSLVLNFYEIAVLLFLLFIRLLFIDIIYDIVYLNIFLHILSGLWKLTPHPSVYMSMSSCYSSASLA